MNFQRVNYRKKKKTLSKSAKQEKKTTFPHYNSKMLKEKGGILKYRQKESRKMVSV